MSGNIEISFMDKLWGIGCLIFAPVRFVDILAKSQQKNLMEGFYLPKFDELAAFNGDSNKGKYNDTYIAKMAELQAEYDDRLKVHAKANGHIVYDQIIR